MTYTAQVNAEIIAIGSELLTPFRQDTDSLFLTDRLNQLGIEVHFKDVVGDNRDQLVSSARIALSRADLIIFVGGLGPTEDDLTRESVAEALGLPLQRQQELIAWLQKRFASRGMKMRDNNLRQADVLAGATVLPNANGSAPGQWLQTEYEGKDRIIILLPGPPHELKPMFDSQCFDRLRAAVPEQFIAKRVLKVAMVGESECDARIAPIYTPFTDVQTTILANAGEVQIHLQARCESKAAAEGSVNELAEKIQAELADRVFSTQGESLEEVVGCYLERRGASLAVAESCTGGLLAERITTVPGSSHYFVGGAVVYSNELKTAFADVPPALINEHGAVSREVATALAEGIRRRCNSSYGMGITGIAGPDGGTPQKPVGLVYISLADGERTEVVERRFPGDRDRVRWWSTQQALDMLRTRLI
ncbi:MAG TPA: competence/damage-inducible protein A [Terriglobales bacterium]